VVQVSPRGTERSRPCDAVVCERRAHPEHLRRPTALERTLNRRSSLVRVGRRVAFRGAQRATPPELLLHRGRGRDTHREQAGDRDDRYRSGRSRGDGGAVQQILARLSDVVDKQFSSLAGNEQSLVTYVQREIERQVRVRERSRGVSAAAA
jgi:hypothetical protein